MKTARKRVRTKDRRRSARVKTAKSKKNKQSTHGRIFYSLGGRKIIEAVKPDFIRGFFKEEYLCLLQAH